jgi:hypothetical protein
VIEHNYFQPAMGAPTSAILAEPYIQHMEHKHIFPVLRTLQIIAYIIYVNDILMIYDQNRTNIEQTLKEFNTLQLSIKFTIQEELHEEINF